MQPINSVIIGNRAEQAAAEFLVRQGFEIIERNYRRRFCEIDIVAQRSGCIHLVEVKFRSSDHFGGGLEYIATQKLYRMQRAAVSWVADRRWNGEYVLSAIAVGFNYEVQEFIEVIEL